MKKTHFQLPYDWTPADREVRAALKESLRQEQIPRPTAEPWYSKIAVSKVRDHLGDLYASELIRSDSSWANPLKDAAEARAKDLVAQAVLRLNGRLHDSLVALVKYGISPSGGILYYTDRVDRCLVFDYDFNESTRAANITARAQILEPDYLYDIDSAITDISPEIRSSLKNVVVYGHKIVGHRNTTVHVDRRVDVDTAGPFIDTIILNEMLHLYLYEFAIESNWGPGSPDAFKSALEIGCGSGMLVTSAGQNVRSLDRIIAVDPNIHSIRCAHKNFSTNVRNKRLIGISGRFQDFPIRDIDLAICNPPYIPEPPGRSPRRDDSVCGTDVLKEVVRSTPTLLSSKGILFLIFSDLASPEYQDALEESGSEAVSLGPPEGFRVRFEQPGVLRDRELVKFLCETRGLEYSQRRKDYHHTLRCVAIHRPKGQASDGSVQLLERFRTLNKKLGEGGHVQQPRR